MKWIMTGFGCLSVMLLQGCVDVAHRPLTTPTASPAAPSPTPQRENLVTVQGTVEATTTSCVDGMVMGRAPIPAGTLVTVQLGSGRRFASGSDTLRAPVSADQQGRFEIPGVPPGATATLTLHGVDAAPRTLTIPEAPSQTVSIRISGFYKPTCPPPDRATIYGRVFDDHGFPLEGAIVRGHMVGSTLFPNASDTLTVATQALGSFTFLGVPYGAEVAITVSKPGYTTSQQTIVPSVEQQVSHDGHRLDFGSDATATPSSLFKLSDV
jgi:hypothetical protein